MEFVIEALEEVAPKHPICSSKPARISAPLPYGGGCGMLPY